MASEATTVRRSPRWTWVAILAGALLVRLPPVFTALPYVYHPDEPTNYDVFHGMVAEHRINPRFFHYPSLFFDVEAVVHALYAALGKAAGWFPSAHAIPGLTEQSDGNGLMRAYGPLVTARLVTVVMGVGIVAAAMVLAWLCTQRRGIAALAGVVCALHPLLIANSGWVTPDTLAGLTATAGVASAAYVARRQTARSYLVAGLMIGLATSAKYNAAVVAVSLIVAHLLFARRAPHAWRNLAIAGGAAALAFLVTTPYALLDWHTFWNDFTFEVRHYRTGRPGNEGGAAQQNLEWLWASTGPFLLCALGCVYARANVRRLLAIPSMFVVVYLVAISVQLLRFERNLVPMLPALLVLASAGAWLAGERLAAAIDNRRWRAFAVFAGVALLAWPVVLTIVDTRAALRDGRAGGRTWIARNIAPGSTIATEGYAPWIDPGRFRVVDVGATLTQRRKLEDMRPDAAIVTTTGSGRYLEGGSARPSARDTLAWLRASACGEHTFGSDKGSIEVFVLHCAASSSSSSG